MSVCRSCGLGNQAGAKFCSECGAALVQAPPLAHEERKVVTVLFADLVGQTGEAERILAQLFGAGSARPGNLLRAVTDAVFAADLLGRGDEARRWLSAGIDLPWFAAAWALVDQDFGRAAESFAAMGAARSAALTRFRAAQALCKAGRTAEAGTQLQPTLDFYRSVGAIRFIHEEAALLAALPCRSMTA